MPRRGFSCLINYTCLHCVRVGLHHFITAPVYAKCSLLFRIIVCAIHLHTHTLTFSYSHSHSTLRLAVSLRLTSVKIFSRISQVFFFSHNLSDAVTTAATLVAPAPFSPLPLALVRFALHSLCGRHRSIQVITKYCDLSLSRCLCLACLR